MNYNFHFYFNGREQQLFRKYAIDLHSFFFFFFLHTLLLLGKIQLYVTRCNSRKVKTGHLKATSDKARRELSMPYVETTSSWGYSNIRKWETAPQTAFR